MLDNANYKWYHMKTWTDSYIVSNFSTRKIASRTECLKNAKGNKQYGCYHICVWIEIYKSDVVNLFVWFWGYYIETSESMDVISFPQCFCLKELIKVIKIFLVLVSSKELGIVRPF